MSEDYKQFCVCGHPDQAHNQEGCSLCRCDVRWGSPVEAKTFILPAEYVGTAEPKDGFLDIGGVQIAWDRGNVGVYVRRRSSDLSVIEIAIASHDGLAQEELDVENAEAERYPLGKKEYWRSKMVGKYLTGPDQHPMTDDEFEAEWDEDDDIPEGDT